MKYGISIPVRGEGATPDAFDKVAARADAAGLDKLWASDHLVMPPPRKARYPGTADGSLPPGWLAAYYQPFSVLNYLAGRTRNLRLGTSVLILPMRNPLEAAAQIAELDQVSRGRIDIGVGVGWFQDEYDALGIDFRTRGRRANEGLEIMKRLWTGGPAAFQGEFHDFSGVRMGPKPVQAPHPPLYIGGHSPAALRRAERFADVWHPFRVTPEQVRELRPHLPEGMPIAPKVPLVVGPERGPLPTQGPLPEVLDALRRYQDAGAVEFCFDIVPETAENACQVIDLILDEIAPALG